MIRVLSMLLLMVVLQTAAQSQPGPAIHIQSENGQAFAVHFSGNRFESSNGYVLIPQLAAGIYNMVLSFPGTELPEYAFACRVSDTQLAYSLKWGVDNSWSLFDMVDFTVVQASRATQEQITAALQKPGTAQPVAIETAPPVSQPPKNIQPAIRKIFDKATPGGKDLVYIVVNGTKTDTVALFIPDLEEAQPKQTGRIRSMPAENPTLSAVPAAAILSYRNKSYSKHRSDAPLFPGACI